MASTKYTYSIQNDFPNHAVSLDRITKEISESSIVIALEQISNSGDVCDIWFKDTLSGTDETTLNTIVAAHSGELLPDNTPQKVELYKGASAVPTASSGVVGQAPAKGLGGFIPDPRNNTYQPNPDEVVSLYADVYGALVTRGQILTDEGSFRDDFVGNIESELTGTVTFTNGSTEITGSGTFFSDELTRAHFIKLQSDGYDKYVQIERMPTSTTALLTEPYSGTTGSGVAVKSRWLYEPLNGITTPFTFSGSKVYLSSGTAQDEGVNLYRGGDYLPLVSVWNVKISKRSEKQTAFLGLRDDVNNPTMYSDILFDGYDNTKITFRSAYGGDEELSHISLPSGFTTDQYLKYKIDTSIDYVGLMINGVLVARHENHVPDPYVPLYLSAGIKNLEAETETTFQLDSVLFSNQDQVQISNNFLSPIPVVSKEDQHTIVGKLSTDTTTLNQNIIEYTVPTDRVFYLIGYRIECLGSVDGFINIGRNDLQISGSQSVDGNSFRSIFINGGGNTGEVDFSSPRKIGVGGDTIRVAVTPKGSLTCEWYAILDFVLR